MTNMKTMIVIALFFIAGFPLTSLSKTAFVENIGQITDQYRNPRKDIVARYSATNGLNIFLSKSGIHYQFATTTQLYRMDVMLIGANPATMISYENPSSSREIYHLAQVKGTAQQYGRITYHDIYPNIDWVFYMNTAGQVEHDFIVHPGGKVSDIKLQYNGADQLFTDKKGNLIAATRYGTIKEPKPYTYELSTQRQVSSNYVLQGNLLTFKTATYKGTLVIDPVIDWATYFGDSEYDENNDVKVGKDGYIYTIGSTNSTANIATSGAHFTTFQGGTNANGADAYISKFDQSGNLIWSTYYGGSGIDIGLALATDSTGNIFASGRTNSQTGIATPGTHQTTKAGNASSYDAFLVKLDTAGTVAWATYFGGNGNEGSTALSITIDRYNNIYMAGNTNSPSGLATPGAFQAIRPGAEEGFIAKFNPVGIPNWSTYYGSSANDYIYKIISDTSGDIIVIGHTLGTTGLSTPGTSLAIGNGGTDGFVTKFDSAGQRVWGTYYGGSDFERMMALTTDSLNNIYIAGLTNSTTGLASANAHQTAIGSTSDGCIAKLSPNGIVEWSTYFGGSEDDAVTGLKFSNGKLFATGWTASSNNISTADGMVPVFNGSVNEGLLATFSPNGQRLWATYFGGNDSEDPKAMALLSNDDLVIAGKTASISGLSTANAHQPSFGGLQDGMLVKIKMCNLPETPNAITGSMTVCENSQQQYIVSPVTAADSYLWIIPNGWSGSSNTDTLNIIPGVNNGVIKVIARNSCGTSDTFSLAVSVNPAPAPIISRNGNILTVSQTFTNYQWYKDGEPINAATDPTYAVTQNGIYTLFVTGANGCQGISNEIIVDNFTSINSLAKLGMKVYPNPFSESLTITSPRDIEITLTDLSGKQVERYKLREGTNEMNLSHLQPGNYFLNAYLSDSIESLGYMTVIKIK